MNAASSSGAGESRGPLRDKPSEASAVTVLLAARVRGAGGGGAARMASRSDTARLAVRTSESPLVFRSLHFFPSHSYPRQRERHQAEEERQARHQGRTSPCALVPIREVIR